MDDAQVEGLYSAGKCVLCRRALLLAEVKWFELSKAVVIADLGGSSDCSTKMLRVEGEGFRVNRI